MISEKEKKITAYHEAGHAILFHVLPMWTGLHVSIIRRVWELPDIPCRFRSGMICSAPKEDAAEYYGRSWWTCGRGTDLWRYYDRCISGYQAGDCACKSHGDSVWYVRELGLIHMEMMRMKYLSDVTWHTPDPTARRGR